MRLRKHWFKEALYQMKNKYATRPDEKFVGLWKICENYSCLWLSFQETIGTCSNSFAIQ